MTMADIRTPEQKFASEKRDAAFNALVVSLLRSGELGKPGKLELIRSVWMHGVKYGRQEDNRG